MIERSEIIFLRDHYEDGFAFLCMKAAYSNGITGKMEYGPRIGVRILAEGEKTRLADFLRWIDKNVKAEKLINLCVGEGLVFRMFKEFDIEYIVGNSLTN